MIILSWYTESHLLLCPWILLANCQGKDNGGCQNGIKNECRLRYWEIGHYNKMDVWGLVDFII